MFAQQPTATIANMKRARAGLVGPSVRNASELANARSEPGCHHNSEELNVPTLIARYVARP